MRTGGSCCASVALIGFAALSACGHGNDHGGLPVSGTDVSCGPSMYISNGGCVGLPPFSDASVQLDEGANDAGPSSADAADSDVSNLDGPSDEGADGPPLDPLAPCAGAGDVFFVRTTYSIGSPATMDTHTDVDSIFLAGVPPPLQITVTPVAPSVLPSTILTLTPMGEGGAPTGSVPAPGTYSTSAPGLQLSLDLEGTDVGYDSGTVIIDEVEIDQTDGEPSRLNSLLMSFELINPGARTITGCVRYLDRNADP